MVHICCYCKDVMGVTDGHEEGDARETHGICDGCLKVEFPKVWIELQKERGGQLCAC